MANPLLLTTASTVASFFGVDILNPSASDWYILNSDGSVALKPDTVQNFDFRVDSRISDFPVQGGAFASYNKVQMPFEIRMTLVCSGINLLQQAVPSIDFGPGAGLMSKQSFLSTLDTLRTTTALVSVVTPDATYNSCTLDRFDYARTAQHGATTLYVDAVFREIRQVGPSNSVVNGLPFVFSNSDSAANPLSTGIVLPYNYIPNTPQIAPQFL